MGRSERVDVVEATLHVCFTTASDFGFGPMMLQLIFLLAELAMVRLLAAAFHSSYLLHTLVMRI